MISLASLQHLIKEYVFLGKKDPRLFDLIKKSNLDPGQRLNIYRNNTLISLQECLKGTFSVIFKIVGEGFFNQIAKKFIRDYPPKNSCLQLYGKEFPNHLLNIPELTEMPYLVDLANFEWLMQASFHAPNYPSLSADILRAISPESFEKLVFKFNPAFQLTQSHYNIGELWETHENGKIDNLTNFDIIYNSTKNFYVIYRLDGLVYFQNITSAEFKFITSLKKAVPVIKSYELAYKIDQNFDLIQIIQHFMRWQSLIGYKSKGEKNE